MERIKKDIKERNFSRFYLLYGSEDFLKNLYRDKLIKAMLTEGDDMNLSRFEGKDAAVNEVISTANTLPFFSERRVIIIKDSGWFKSSCEIADYIQNFPETTCMIFVESDVDKRNKLYKYVSANGYSTKIDSPGIKDILPVVAATLKQKGLQISREDCEYFVTKVGSDMSRIQTELDKLVAYCNEKQVVTAEDIDGICSEVPEGKIFLMIDAIMAGQEDRALQLYYQLLAAHEKAMSVLFMLIRSYNQLYQVLSLSRKGTSKQRIMSISGVRDFMVDKYVRLGQKFETEKIKDIVSFGIELEERVKQGNLDERMAVEIFIVKYSGM
ncbi:MAG: DNA polymerase III subunit delta [Lachnospiraceae bacterium]